MQTHIPSTKLRPALPALRFVLASLVVALPLVRATGQLAITEVQSAQSTTPMIRGSDYWELTNFGTNTVDLASYRFADSTGFDGGLNLTNLMEEPWRIGPGESIVFARWQTGLTTPDEFRQWWGDSNLRPDLRISVAPWGFGFSSTEDYVQLWEVTPGQTNLVDRVELFRSDPGDTFTCDPVTGLLNAFSKAGVNGAFQAATTTDVGSPGVVIGRVPLQIVRAPASTEVDGGSPVTLAVQAYGLPRPRYQWRFNDQAIPAATEPTFTIANAGGADAGEYTVEVSNGLATVLTPPATLTVNLIPRCATMARGPSDLAVTPGQTAIFGVEVRGFPLPEFRWQFNGVDIPDATNATLLVANCDESRAGFYTVRVMNPLCVTNAGARLSVVPPPHLVITEAMASPSTNTTVPGHNDWWELTNADTNAVNLRGYRFDDFPGVLEGAVTVTNDVVLQPGRSMIWVSDMTPAEFRRWWGEENLPADLPIISYPGNGFAAVGDSIRLWNATALTRDDKIVSLSFVNLEMGVSLLFDDGACEFGSEFGCLSVEGDRGAFRAAESDDIGSPGWINNEQRVVRPRITSVRHDAAGVTLTWKTQPGRTYELQNCNDLAQPDWHLLLRLPADGDLLTAMDSTAGAASRRFYRVLLLPITP